MQKGYSVLFVLLALGCQNKSTDTKVTNDIIACVDASDSLITQSLWKFEQYLIARNYVVKSSLSSYIDFKQECLNNHVEIDRSDLHDYMYDHGNTQMFLASVTRMATIIKCINNSDLKNAEPDLYEAFCYTFSMHERGAAKILAEENDMKITDVSYAYSELSDNYLKNRLFRLGILWSLYPER